MELGKVSKCQREVEGEVRNLLSYTRSHCRILWWTSWPPPFVLLALWYDSKVLLAGSLVLLFLGSISSFLLFSPSYLWHLETVAGVPVVLMFASRGPPSNERLGEHSRILKDQCFKNPIYSMDEQVLARLLLEKKWVIVLPSSQFPERLSCRDRSISFWGHTRIQDHFRSSKESWGLFDFFLTNSPKLICECPMPSMLKKSLLILGSLWF